MGWFLPWVLIAAVVGAAIWFLVGVLGGDEVKPTVADASPTPSATPLPTETEELVLASPTPSRTKDKPKAKPKPKPTKTAAPELITEGINVQVLNGTSDTTVDDALADELTGLGFRIEAVDDSSKAYSQTTVFWSYPEAQEAAEALAARYGWVAQPKPDNLSPEVALHVVVGADRL